MISFSFINSDISKCLEKGKKGRECSLGPREARELETALSWEVVGAKKSREQKF